MKRFFAVLPLLSVMCMSNNAALGFDQAAADDAVNVGSGLLRIGFVVFIVIVLWRKFKKK